MKFMIIFLHLLVMSNIIMGRSVGVIRNATLRFNPSLYIMITRSRCNECLCDMFTGIGNQSIVSFNCLMLSASQVTCEMFNKKSYNTSSYLMETNQNSIFYFLELPPPIVTTNAKLATTAGKISELSTIKNRHFLLNY